MISKPKSNQVYLEADIESMIDAVCSEKITFEDLDLSIKNLEEYIFNMDGADQHMLAEWYDNISADRKKLLNDRYCEWETVHENIFADDVLSGIVNSSEEYLLYNRFYSLISKEIALLNGKDFQNFLFIGSGPFPITAILWHKLTGKIIDCLERDEKAAEVSREVLRRLGLSDVINVYVGEGGSYDLSPYDVILNALLAKPKWCIMKNIKEKCLDSTLVLCRTSYGLRKLLYESTSANAIHGYNIGGKQIAGYDDTISTLLLVNKNKTVSGISLEWLESINDAQKTQLIDMMNQIIKHDNHNGFLRLMRHDDLYFDVLERDLKLGLKHLLIIYDGDKMLGQLLLNLSYIDTYQHRADVSTLMIDESIRGREISLKVVMALLDKCDTLGIKYITLDVRAGSKVSLLWKYLGFDSYGELECYSKVDETVYKGVFMYKDVKTLKNTLTRKFNNLYRIKNSPIEF